MKKPMKYLVVMSVILLGVALAGGDVLAIGQSTNYGYSGNQNGQCTASGCGETMQQMRAIRVPCQGYQGPQQPIGYCIRWVPAQQYPVQVMVPGRWEYQPTWIPGREITLYQHVPGYWQRTNLNGMPNMPIGQTPNVGYNAPQYQQTGTGYFNAQGVWSP